MTKVGWKQNIECVIFVLNGINTFVAVLRISSCKKKTGYCMSLFT